MNDLNVHKPTNHRTAFAILFLFFLLAYMLPLGARDLLVPDETRYGEIPREMIVSGDWVVPHLNGVRYFEKPVLGYWVHAGSLLLFGENAFAVRLPSALAVGLSALLIFLLARQATRNQDQDGGVAAILSALIFLSCFEVFGVGNTAVLDRLFSFFLTACLIAFYFATEERPGSSREKGLLLLAGLACGLAFLTKGFLAFVLPVLALVPYLAWQRRYVDLFRMSWLPILTAVMVALPWGILIHLKEPDFWRFFFWNEHVRRFMAESAQHKESFWFFFIAAPGLFMPWTFVAPAAATAIKDQLDKQSPKSNLLKLCICWMVYPFLFFSLSKGKLLTYILPCFSPFAVLMGIGLSSPTNKQNRKILQYGIAATGLFLVIIFLALLSIQLIGFRGFHLYRQSWKPVLLASGLFFMILFSFWSLHNNDTVHKVIIFGCAPFLFFLVGHFIIPNLVIEESAPGRLLEKHRAQIQPDTAIISCEDAVGAADWFLKRDDVYLLKAAGELDYGLDYQDASGRLLDTESAIRIINENKGHTVLICKAEKIRNRQKGLPAPVYREVSGPTRLTTVTGFVFRGSQQPKTVLEVRL
jgi:4-amino-4-deoxy-L-arabinose transferase